MNERINIFISHSTKGDKPLAKLLMQWLNSAYTNISVFVSSASGIRCGQCPSIAIQDALQKADILIAILSPEAMSNDWVIFEIGSIFGRGRKVFPVLCRGGDVSKAPRSVRTMYQIMSASNKDEFTTVIEDLDSAIGMRHNKPFAHLRNQLSKCNEKKNEERETSMQPQDTQTKNGNNTINNKGDNNINNIGTLIIKASHNRSRPAVPTSGVIGTSPIQRSYAKHLYDRLVYLKSKIPGYTPVRAGVTVARLVNKEFGATLTNIPIERYNDFCRFLQMKIDETPIGRKNSKAKIKNYSSEEEFLSKHHKK